MKITDRKINISGATDLFPDNTAIRTALLRAMNSIVDQQLHIIHNDIGLKLMAPENDWLDRPDLKFTASLRASVVLRTHFSEDFFKQKFSEEHCQLVIIGSGLDSFALRNSEPIEIRL